MGFFSSGSAAVDAMGRIEISGNITPQKWYKEILRENGKPYLLAIILLSDIVYWYRPVEVRDEVTGNTIGWRKKFRSDLLQKTYEQYANQFGETKRTIKAALDRLEELGLIKKVFRDITLQNGTRIPNVMYIALNPERIDEITHEDIDPDPNGPGDKPTGNVDNFSSGDDGAKCPETAENKASVGGGTKFCMTSPEIMYDPLQNNVPRPAKECATSLQNFEGYPSPDCGTNTENTTEIFRENTSENTTQITHGEHRQVMSCPEEDDDALLDQIDWSRPIKITMAEPDNPVKVRQDRQDERSAYIEMLKDQVQYEVLCQEDTYHDRMDMVDGIINIIADIATTEPPDGCERINGRQYPHEVVKSRLLKMDYETITHVLGRLKENTTEIKNMRSYLLTALYNARDERDIQFQNYFNHTYYGTDWRDKGAI